MAIPAIVLEVQHRTPGNLRAFVPGDHPLHRHGKERRCPLRLDDKVETVDVNRSKLEFSYKDHQGYHFMDPENYETSVSMKRSSVRPRIT
jgi:elongation factor P